MTSDPVRPDPVAAVALLDEPTRRRLYEVVAASDEPVGRDRAATVRRRQPRARGVPSRRLTEAGLWRPSTGGWVQARPRGRPAGQAVPPGGARHRRVAPAARRSTCGGILETAITEVGDPAVVTAIAAAAHDRGAEAAAAAKAASRPRSDRRRREALVELLTAGGYEPVVDAEASAIRLRTPVPRPRPAAPRHHVRHEPRLGNGVVEGLGLSDVDAVSTRSPGPAAWSSPTGATGGP